MLQSKELSSPPFGDDQIESLARVLGLIRSGAATTRPEIARVSGYGRTLVSYRLQQLTTAGLIREGRLKFGARGRGAVVIDFVADRGHVLSCMVSASSIHVGLSDLDGTLIETFSTPTANYHDLSAILRQCSDLLVTLLDGKSLDSLWGIAIGLPAPINHRTGRPSGSGITPSWENFPVREFLESTFKVPVWVDNDVNLMALGASRRAAAVGMGDVIYAMAGAGFGAGILSDGHLHHGATGAAGEINHVRVDSESSVRCYCGNLGCLIAVAGGDALVTAAQRQVAAGIPSSLSDAGASRISIEAIAAARTDPVATKLMGEAASALGSVLADLVNFYNPSVVYVAGPFVANDEYLRIVREEILRRAHPLASASLLIEGATDTEHAGLIGAAGLALDSLLSSDGLSRMIASSV